MPQFDLKCFLFHRTCSSISCLSNIFMPMANNVSQPNMLRGNSFSSVSCLSRNIHNHAFFTSTLYLFLVSIGIIRNYISRTFLAALCRRLEEWRCQRGRNSHTRSSLQMSPPGNLEPIFFQFRRM